LTSHHPRKTGAGSSTRSRLAFGGVVAALLAAIGLFVGIVVVSYNLLHADNVTGPSVSSLGPTRIVGAEETVFSWPRDHCALLDYPDAPARAFRDARGRTQLIASHYVTRRMVGDSFGRLIVLCWCLI
jgi:hypothetical protein